MKAIIHHSEDYEKHFHEFERKRVTFLTQELKTWSFDDIAALRTLLLEKECQSA